PRHPPRRGGHPAHMVRRSHGGPHGAGYAAGPIPVLFLRADLHGGGRRLPASLRVRFARRVAHDTPTRLGRGDADPSRGGRAPGAPGVRRLALGGGVDARTVTLPVEVVG